MLRFITSVVVALFMVSGVTFAQENGMVNTDYLKKKRRADRLLEAKDTTAAVKMYTEAMQSNPQAVEPYERLGQIFSSYQAVEYQSVAKDYYNQCIQLTDDTDKKLAYIRKVKEIDAAIAALAGGTAIAINTPLTPVPTQPTTPTPAPVTPTTPTPEPTTPAPATPTTPAPTAPTTPAPTTPTTPAANTTTVTQPAIESNVQPTQPVANPIAQAETEITPAPKPQPKPKSNVQSVKPKSRAEIEREYARLDSIYYATVARYDSIMAAFNASGDSLLLDSLPKQIPPEPAYVMRRQIEGRENVVTGEPEIVTIEYRERTTKEEKQQIDAAAAAEELAAQKAESEQKANNAQEVKKSDNPFLNNKKDKPQQPSGQAPSFLYRVDKDPLYQAFSKMADSQTPATTPLYAIRHQPEAPLASELEKEESVNENASTEGRWASTLRNAETLRELIVLTIQEGEKKASLNDDADLKLQQNKYPRWHAELINQDVDAQMYQCTYKFSFTERNYSGVCDFITKMLLPYIGTLTEKNHKMVDQLSAETNTDYPVVCTLGVLVKPKNNILYGTFNVNCVIDRDSVRIPVLSETLPCTLYRISDVYNGFDESTVNINNFLSSDTTMIYDIQGKQVKSAGDFNNLGYCFLNGMGVKKDLKKALGYFEDAKKKGNKEACANLYLMHRRGWGCEPNFIKALECLAEGRTANSVPSVNISADLLEESGKNDYQQMKSWYISSQMKKDVYAEYRIAMMMLNGQGYPASPTAAFGNLERIKTESADAYYQLAIMSLTGTGCDKVFSVAYNYAMEGARAGSPKAMRLLAELYFTGYGVRRNFAMGKKWLAKEREAMQNKLNGYMYVGK